MCEYICCRVLDCVHNTDYRCERYRVHINPDGVCVDYCDKDSC